MSKTSHSAFTLIEMLVVISIIAVLAALAVPRITDALVRGQMTGTLNNARQLYLAGFQMATDGTTNSDPNLSWPGDAQGVTTLEEYASRLVQNDYLKPGDLQKILTAPGAIPTVEASTADDQTTVDLSGKSGLKVYRVREPDASNTIFAASGNFTYDTALKPADVPYGDKGFVVMRKGGDASVFRKNQATKTNFGGDIEKYQNSVGILPSDPESGNVPVQESSNLVLTAPQ